MRTKYQLAATPLSAEDSTLIALGDSSAHSLEVSGDGWRARVTDKGRRDLSFNEFRDLTVLADLLERVLVITFEQIPQYWRLSASTRYWYDKRPAASQDGVEMIRRISFSTIVIPDEGIGVALDFGHLFQSEKTLDFYFNPTLTKSEGQKRGEEFDRLRGRSDRRKGTLLYNIGSQTRSSCYFTEAGQGVTCERTGLLEFGGQRYGSLYEYYQVKRPRLGVQPDDAAVYVSFPGIKGDRPVAARLLRLRVNLDPQKIPSSLRRRIPIPPDVREQLSSQLWRQIAERVTRRSSLYLSPHLWTPPAEKQELLPCPTLIFGQNHHVRGPKQPTVRAYQSYYRERRERLLRDGLFDFDETASRDLILVTPSESSRWSSKLQNTFVSDLVDQIDDLAKRRFRAKVLRAERCEEIVQVLESEKKCFVVLVFDDRERAAYSVLSHELSGWRLKRFTRQTIERAWRESGRARSEVETRRAERRWNDMMFHSAIDILDQMGATPWRLTEWEYEACLAIDVSEDRRYFGLSLLICRDEMHWPSFYRVTRTWPKGDHQHETIQAALLADKMDQLIADLQKVADGFDPLDSLLVLRDGRNCGDEIEGIQEALERWRERGALSQEAFIDVAALLKHSIKHIRTWRRHGNRVTNVLEGQAVYLDEDTAILHCTGEATLGGHGTSDPLIIEARDDGDIRRIARGVFALSQLNYASPTKAQREPAPIKELDASLKDRIAHDMRGIK